MHTVKAEITDLFSSIQGEGIFVGAKQVFIRFRQCNLACAFCDEPWRHEPRSLTAAELVTEVRSLDLHKGPHHSVSLTGGEPLMYAGYLRVLLKLLRKDGLRGYLETNGTLPDALAQIIDLVDIIAMDFKLPSSTGLAPFWDEHEKFLKVASERNVFVKIVVTPKTTREDIERSIDIIKRLKKDIPLVIQPVTPRTPAEKPVDSGRLLEFLEIGAKNRIVGMRVIPQIHKMLGVK